MTATLEFWLYLPQMRMSMDDLVTRARVAEASGFVGLAGMDHLAPPGGEHWPMFEAMITSAWLAGHTDALRVGSLVLCDSFREPVVLAREAVSIDHASGGRFELGIGWGSVPAEMDRFGVGSLESRSRISRLKESLDIITALWRGDPVDYHGEHFRLRGAQVQPLPLGHIPIVIGGAGPKTMELVSSHADWWNLHVGILDRFEEMRPLAGAARCSLQLQIGFVGSEASRPEVESTTRRRFGDRALVADATELVDNFASLRDRGVERLYVWFSDFALPDTLSAFGERVIGPLSTS